MIDYTLNELFSEIFDMVICIDGVWYAPLTETLSTLMSCAVVVAAVFGFVLLIFHILTDLLYAVSYDLIEAWKNRKQPRDITDLPG